MPDARNAKLGEARDIRARWAAEVAHAADVVDQLNQQDVGRAVEVLTHLPLEYAVEVFDRPELDRAGELLLALPGGLAGRVLAGMSDDRAADTLRHLEGQDRTRLLAPLDFETAASLKQLLTYPRGTAGSLMTTEFVSVPATATGAETLRHIREVERSRETIYTICVLDPHTRALVRTVSLRQLIMGQPDQNILEVAPFREPIVVAPETDREEVARLVSVHDLLAVPVLNERLQVLGIVTVDDVIDAIVAESTEDVQRFGGVEAWSSPTCRSASAG